ncbi:terpene cyclase/mutase family protein [Sphingomonas sp. QA11]|uniref:prenyltransferase/squalene oxidase repeat-containing protein n=1 Tax=Sphingomonas sp. QA11 TaxID=2950605 RepID=UPI00234A8884|nr:prenyltransferase/squalene oxidase repeat-containing protein [Sphingomonas sp. QA11]WCM26976.1 terpene cyclase/mutase family protein [Sphingomonas sp. QA11]
MARLRHWTGIAQPIIAAPMWLQNGFDDEIPARRTLAAYLDLLLPGEMGQLIPPSARARIAAAARTMPGIPRIAVECRLAAANDQVDIQQCFRHEDDGVLVLAEHARALALAHPDAAWARGLKAFAEAVAHADSALSPGITEIFLEFDLPVAAAPPSAPSVFFSLPEDQAVARAITIEAATLLRGEPLPDGMAVSIARCFSACPDEARVSHIGMMLSRQVDAVRVNIKGMRPADLPRFLADCAWPGDPDGAVRLLDDGVLRSDRVTLALDIGHAPFPRIGIECLFDDQPGEDQRWGIFLRDLADQGLCAPDKIAPFLAVPGETVPPRAGQDWPTPFLRAALLQGETDFSAFARRVAHIKVTETLGMHREAKAYFGAGHLWLTPGRTGQRGQPTFARPAAARPADPVQATGNGLDRAIEAAVTLLCARQQQSDFWRDFRIGDGIADEWVTAFVATHLMLAGGAPARRGADRAWRRLERCQRPDGGWGYSRDYPPDADSTAWTLRLATALGHETEETAHRGRAFLARHAMPEGGVTTYAEQAALAARIGLPANASFAGWRQPHQCVTAAAAPFLPGTALSYLRTTQQDGQWHGYWWAHDAYATALAVEGLAGSPIAGDGPRIAAAAERARAWLRALGSEGGPTAFDAAFCLRILLADPGPHDDVIGPAIARLLEHQDDDGSWREGARLRVPMPGSTDATLDAGRVTIDQRRSFTTAAVAGALGMIRRHGSGL